MADNKYIMSMLVNIAKKEVGVREDAKNNTGERIRLYQSATWLEPGAWPWCAAFTCWLLSKWLALPEVQDVLNFHTQKDLEEWRCKDASAFGWEKWAIKNNIKVLDEKQLAKAGDFVVFDFSHIGLVSEDQKTIQTPISTIEGNTNGKGERDSVSGDGVWEKKREPSLTKSYIRILS